MVSTRQIDRRVPSSSRPPMTGTVPCGEDEDRTDVVAAVARRARLRRCPRRTWCTVVPAACKSPAAPPGVTSSSRAPPAGPNQLNQLGYTVNLNPREATA